MKVLYFAGAREIVGSKAEEIDTDEIAAHAGDGSLGTVSVSDLLDLLGSRHGPEFVALVQRSTIMSDDQIVNREDLTTTPLGVEVAVLPPVSGGDGPMDGDPGRAGHHAHGQDTHGAHSHAHGDDPDRVAPTLDVAVLTVSDRASSGVYDDRTGPALVDLLRERLPVRTITTHVVADDADAIARTVAGWCDDGGPDGRPIDLVVTNGGTGLSDRDVTPEALRRILDVEAPGLGEVMRMAGLRTTPLAALSRQLGGRRRRTVVVAVPGSVRAATESLDAVVEILPHLCELAAGQNPAERHPVAAHGSPVGGSPAEHPPEVKG